jgi:glycosyltransferase involved in cell wall biosynthesis
MLEGETGMTLAIIIASAGRRDVLALMLQHLQRQSRRPDVVVLSTPGPDDVPDLSAISLNIRILHGSKGLTRQRNTALNHVAGRFNILTFFDDDFLPASHYLERLIHSFESNSHFAVIHGNVIADGAHNEGYGFEEGLRILVAAEAATAGPVKISDHFGAYGCNMSIRGALVGDRRFDERLVLYGWQEDMDFTNQFGRFGRIVSDSGMIGVHLGVKSARVTGTRLGYSQIVNPIYLVRKGTMPASYAARLMARNLLANAAKSIVPEPWIDRRGRLYGNLIACSHVVRGKIEPEFVLKL